MKKVYELDFHGKKIVVENGEVAKQASGSVIVRYGDTVELIIRLFPTYSKLSRKIIFCGKNTRRIY